MKIDKDYAVAGVLGVALVGFAIAYSTDSLGAGFREQESWKFKTPFERSVDLSVHQSKMLRQGGYFQGEHTARYYNIDMNVEHMEAEGFQEVTNIGTYQDNTIDGNNNTLNVDSVQRSAEQTGQNGMATRNSATEQMLNVGAAE